MLPLSHTITLLNQLDLIKIELEINKEYLTWRACKLRENLDSKLKLFSQEIVLKICGTKPCILLVPGMVGMIGAVTLHICRGFYDATALSFLTEIRKTCGL